MIFSTLIYFRILYILSGTVYFRYKYIMKIIYTLPKYGSMKKDLAKILAKRMDDARILIF